MANPLNVRVLVLSIIITSFSFFLFSGIITETNSSTNKTLNTKLKLYPAIQTTCTLTEILLFKQISI